MSTSASSSAKQNPSSRFRRFLAQRIKPNAVLQVYLLVCTSLVLVPHLFQQRTVILIFCIALLGWQVMIITRTLSAPMRITRLLLTLTSIVLIFTQPTAMMSQNAGVELLLMMTCLKLFETTSARDTTVTYGLCLFVLLTAFLYNSSIYMWVYSLLVIYAILHSIQFTSSQNTQHKIVLRPDKSLLRIMALGLPLTALVFIVLPRPAAPLWGIPSQGGMAKTGLTEQMSPGAIGQLGDNDSVAFRVKFFGNAPDISDMYWRGPIFTFYNGHTWNEPKFAGSYIRYNQPQKMALPGNADNSTRYHYQVLLNPDNRKWLFALNINDAAPPLTHYTPTDQLLASRAITTSFIYEIDPSKTKIARNEIEPFTRRYLRLPTNFGKQARQLVAQFKTHINKQRPYDRQIVEQALNYFRNNNFVYTRKPAQLLRDPVDQFLFDSRAGFCEHYASAFAFLMRAADIPARIVTGYQGADYNPAQDYYIVRQSNAHAWTEVWIQNQGWTRIDPTRVIPPGRIDRSSINAQQTQDARKRTQHNLLAHPIEMISDYFDLIDYEWGLHVVGFDLQSQIALFKTVQQHLRTILLTVLILVSAFIVVIVLLARRRFKIYDPVARSYQRFCYLFSRRGLSKAAHETPNQFAQRAVQRYPRWKAQIEQVTSLYLQLRYSKTPAIGAIAQLQHQVKALRI